MSLTAKLYDQKGKESGTLSLPKEIFGAKVNEGLMHQLLVMQQANRRNPIAHTLTRGEKAISKRKIYRQKGTGGARHGQKSANIFRGGGVVFGPRNVRNFTKMMPRTMRRSALFSALTVKANDKKILGLKEYKAEKPNTKEMMTLLTAMKIERNALIVMPEKNDGLYLSARNLPNTKVILAPYLNMEDLRKYDNLIIMEAAVKTIEETFNSSKK